MVRESLLEVEALARARPEEVEERHFWGVGRPEQRKGTVPTWGPGRSACARIFREVIWTQSPGVRRGRYTRYRKGVVLD